MQLAMIGLGKMGANMTRRLLQAGVSVVGYNRSAAKVQELSSVAGFSPAGSLADAVGQLPLPRVVWLMLPSGEPTAEAVEQLGGLLQPGDILVDGGNANYHDSQARARLLAAKQIEFVDAGVSGGVWGLQNGYCLMLGGSPQAVETLLPAVHALAPAADRGWAHLGPAGAGHFSKMIHNGIEYGMMQALAEGFALLQGKQEFDYDLAEIAELWRHGSVVRSWLLDLMAGFLQQDQQLDTISPFVADSGEGRWTVEESIHQGLPAPVLTLALQMRFASQDEQSYTNRLLSKMRQAFGGHAVVEKS